MGRNKNRCDDCGRIIRTYSISFFKGRFRCKRCQSAYSRKKLENTEKYIKENEQMINRRKWEVSKL